MPYSRHESRPATASSEPQNCGVTPVYVASRNIRPSLPRLISQAIWVPNWKLRRLSSIDQLRLVSMYTPSSTSASRSSSVPSPGSRWRLVMRTSGIRFQPSARIEPPLPAPIRRRLAGSKEAREEAGFHHGRAFGRNAFVVEREAAEPTLGRRVRCDVHQPRAVAQGTKVAWLEEARAGVRGLGAVDAIELGGMTDRLV